MPSLEAIAGWENAVAAGLAGASGTLEQRDLQVTRSGLYAEYPAIVRSYIEHFDDERTAPEALKRAVFLVWYGTAAPAPLTGIAEIPEPDARTVMETLEAWVRRGRADAELRWMVAWYHEALPDAFALWGAAVAVATLAAEMPPDSWRRLAGPPASFARRGLMGDYWRALVEDG